MVSVLNPFRFNKTDPMGPVYAVFFYLLLSITCILAWLSQPKSQKTLPQQARTFKWLFLSCWYICVAGDWLQGPYVYALYDSYGFSRQQISQLFVAGFGASMVFGTFVGSLADRIGRKRSCQLYCIFYILSCFTKHFASYTVLMVGRVFGGIATSLLFSGFESWLVAEATTRQQLDSDALGHIFALMWFGNSLVAVVAGIVGDVFVSFNTLHAFGDAAWHYGGYCSPFDLAIGLLLVGLVLISLFWEENYGTPQRGAGLTESFQISAGLAKILTNRHLFIIMILVACFEGSMYTFVFNWTPALQNSFSTPPFGMVFATFMMAYMCGSSSFDLFRGRGVAALRLVQVALNLGALSFLLAGIAFQVGLSVGHLAQIYIGFLVFEFCCGLYFPSVSFLKGQMVPESVRSTVYNIYRVPMNGIVLVVLLTSIKMTTVFIICFCLLTIAGCSTLAFRRTMAPFKDEESACLNNGAAPEAQDKYGTVESK